MPSLRRNVSLFTEGVSMNAVRAGFALGERVSPRATARVGQRLWFHVTPPPPHARRDRGFGNGETVDVVNNGRRIAAHAWGSGPVVLLLHGWSGWWQQLGTYVGPLVQAGYRVVAFDAPSHGDSEPGRYGRHYSGMPDFADAAEAVARAVAGGHPHAIVSHSAASIGVAVALTRGIRADRIVMVSPSVSGHDQVDFVGRRLGWGPKTMSAVLAYTERAFGVDLDDYTVERFVERHEGPLPPALLIHDRRDRATPVAGTQLLASHWPGSEVVLTEGLGHFRILWDADIRARVVDFVTS